MRVCTHVEGRVVVVTGTEMRLAYCQTTGDGKGVLGGV